MDIVYFPFNIVLSCYAAKLKINLSSVGFFYICEILKQFVKKINSGIFVSKSKIPDTLIAADLLRFLTFKL